jgi:hypothetical protein
MRRNDESFKQEVFRRYGVQKRNRRNLQIYIASTLTLCLLACGFALSLFTGESLPQMVASWFDHSETREPNRLADYFDEPVASMQIINIGGNRQYDCTDAEAKDTVDLLTTLSLTQEDDIPPESALLYRIRAKLPLGKLLRDVIVVIYEDGILRVNGMESGAEVAQSEYFQIAPADYTAILKYLKKMVGEPVPVTKPPEPDTQPELPNTDDSPILLASLIHTNDSAKLSFQNTYDYCTTVEVTSPGEIEEVYALFESITGTPVYGLEMTPGEGYKFTFSYTSGDKRWLIIDPNNPYVSFSYLPVGKSQPASRWYQIPTERWETIVSSWMRKWEKTMRSHVAAPPLESYLSIEQGRVSFRQNNQNVYPLKEDGKALLSLISEKLENTTILYDHPAFESWVQIRVEVGDLYTILTVSLDGNFITVSPCHNDFIMVGDYYHFALPAEDMEEIQTYIESLTEPS